MLQARLPEERRFGKNGVRWTQRMSCLRLDSLHGRAEASTLLMMESPSRHVAECQRQSDHFRGGVSIDGGSNYSAHFGKRAYSHVLGAIAESSGDVSDSSDKSDTFDDFDNVDESDRVRKSIEWVVREAKLMTTPPSLSVPLPCWKRKAAKRRSTKA